MLFCSAEVVAGSAAWLGKGLSCVCAQRRDSDSRLSFDLTPAEVYVLLSHLKVLSDWNPTGSLHYKNTVPKLSIMFFKHDKWQLMPTRQCNIFSIDFNWHNWTFDSFLFLYASYLFCLEQVVCQCTYFYFKST